MQKVQFSKASTPLNTVKDKKLIFLLKLTHMGQPIHFPHQLESQSPNVLGLLHHFELVANTSKTHRRPLDRFVLKIQATSCLHLVL